MHAHTHIMQSVGILCNTLQETICMHRCIVHGHYTRQLFLQLFDGAYIPAEFLTRPGYGPSYSRLGAYVAHGYQQLDPLVLSRELHTTLCDT